MSSPRFVLPLTLCSFWNDALGHDVAGAAPGSDPRFAPDVVVTMPIAVEKRAPDITDEQRLRNVPLKGLFTFVVSPKGVVVDVCTLSCNNEAFEQACALAIRRWTFQPMTLNGEGVWCRLQVPIAWNS